MIKIGVLCPYSSIYPNLHLDFLTGMRLALPKDYQKKIEFIEEYISKGSRADVKQALEKLVQFNRVDLLTGFCNYKVLPDLISTIQNRNVIAFMADMGEIVPSEQIINDRIYFNSFGLWQTEYALGNWAHREFSGNGEKGAICMSLYESGYQIHSAFMRGVASAGGEEIETSVIPKLRAGGEVMKQYFEEYVLKFKKERPAYVHALFAGQEAVDFIGMYYEKGLVGEVPLIVSSHMASDEILRMLNGVEVDLYSASLWDVDRKAKENVGFVRDFRDAYGNIPNIFNLLGYEIGMALRAGFKSIMQKDPSGVKKLLRNQPMVTPRGEKLFNWDSTSQKEPIYIDRITMENGLKKRFTVDQRQKAAHTLRGIQSITQNNVTGFLNPYLCI